MERAVRHADVRQGKNREIFKEAFKFKKFHDISQKCRHEHFKEIVSHSVETKCKREISMKGVTPSV
jgi:hypothetical protein